MKRIITIVLIAASALFFFSCKSAGNGPEALVKQAMAAIEKGDYDAYAATFNVDPDTQKMIAGLMEEKASQEIEKKGGFKGYDIIDTQIEGDKASVKVKVLYKDGSEDDQTMKLIKVEDGWKQELNK
ncbi:MAG: DUF4878 domain-containing protein [Bacteroidales bacterium]|nr:DUF4878 domain-containing protein [Bacteroidales bacterium]